jgi:hypothetical protein
VCVLLAYAADLGRGFVADDFGWIYFSRIRSAADAWRLLLDGAPGFYRPIVALSFGVNELLFGFAPMAYALTNLALAAAVCAGIVRLAGASGLGGAAAVFGAGLWVLNFHGISMGLIWISGRTSLLTALFAVFAALAFLRGRTMWAGWLTLGALLSKEEPILLPVVFAAWMAGTIREVRRRGVSLQADLAAIARATWPPFAAVAVYLAMRARTEAFTPSTAPPFYQLSASPAVIVPNALQYLDRSLTFTAAVLLLGILIFARRQPRLDPAERQAVWKGVVWLVLGFGVTIMIPVRSSLYVVYPTIGSALLGAAIGQAVWRAIPEPRRRAAAAGVMLLPLVLLPIHWLRHQPTKRQAMLSTQTLTQIRATLSVRPDAQRIVILDDPAARPTVASAFGSELPRAIELVTGRALPADIVIAPQPRTVDTPHDTLAFILREGKVVPYDASVSR